MENEAFNRAVWIALVAASVVRRTPALRELLEDPEPWDYYSGSD